MTGVIYRGDGDDVRELSAADLKLGGVEEGFRLTRFPVGVVVDVSVAAADALVGNDLYGNFEFAEDTEKTVEMNAAEMAEALGESASAKKKAAATAKTESTPTDSGTVQASTIS